MPIGHNTPPPPAIQDSADHTQEPEHAPDTTDTTTGAEHLDGEAALRIWEGLSPQAMILIPTFITPMRQPDQTWAMLVNAVDLVGDIAYGAELELFAGSWLTEQPPADLCDGDLVTRLTPHDNGASAVDVEMLLACHSRWHRVGFWPHLDTAWPVTVAPTAAAVMGLHTDLAESSARHITAALTTPGSPSERGTISALLDAELVTPGDEFLWERRNSSVRHTARVRVDGTLALADGRLCATPTGAATALGGYPQHGWGTFRRVTDGRTLADLRTALHAGRHQQ